MASFPILKTVSPSDIRALQFDPVDAKAREQAAAIIAEVREKKLEGLIDVAIRLGDIQSRDDKLIYSRDDLKIAFDSLDESAQLVTFCLYHS